jgi:3-oxoacyl-[acyl-carrier protein] reductase
MVQRLKDEVALVTGASKGIGAAISRRFAEESASVAINYNSSEQKARELAAEIERAGGTCIIIRADVSKTPEVKQMVSKVLAEYGRLDILINNAGILIPKGFLESTDDDWDKVLSVNLKGAYICCTEVAPIMLGQERGGKIINISSISGLSHPTALRFVDYVSSKTGMIGMTRSLALALGPKVRVNAICPGAIETDMLTSTTTEARRTMAKDESFLKRLGSPEDIAGVATFLASDDSDFVTGEVLTVGGGRGMR